MNRKRLGQLLIGGVFAACAVVITSLIDLVKQEERKDASGDDKPKKSGGTDGGNDK